ncbi:MAG TPA: type I restriction endonuclease [Candidatus Hodarchaeales archaeon]|nr:type I restriction endonuclease [Candidatus Hodarchaeales archaeon]
MNNREEGREEVRRLIHSFQVNVAGYRRPGSLYYETSLRTDFLDPLLCALGWDVNNYKELPQDLREVVQETTIEVSENESSKKPDYAFRVGRQFRFFLEAKKPSVRVGEEKASAFQARRYGFSASHPICVLSNFDCTIIYRTIEPPDMDDDPRSGIIAKYSFKELITCFDDLYDSISREALYNGHFEKIFAADEQRLLYQQFDAYFLKQIELWRMVLASDISQRNMKIGANELNYFVQRILNRIIFLRICEDRNLERYESLKKLSMGGTYEDLKSLFRKAEKRYNSGLFNLIEDPTLNIQVGNEALIKVLVDLYYPKSPYTFAVVGANVLGAIYEQFISKRIEIGSKRTVDLKEKPEVREGGGVFLTPRYVVEALVQRTLDPLVARKTAQDVAKLRIADICCGSGTFLLGVFEYLQSWYLDWYLKDGSEKHSDRIYEVGGGNWRLMLQEKRRILLTNIFGVDIDEQAVEVTQF